MERWKKEEILLRLTDQNDKAAYAFTRELSAASAESDAYLYLIPDFAGLLTDPSSYVRTRGFLLLCSQARWADAGQLGEVWDRMAPMLRDERPTALRQALKALREVVLYRPELEQRIRTAVEAVDPRAYPDTLAPLIEKDRKELLRMFD